MSGGTHLKGFDITISLDKYTEKSRLKNIESSSLNIMYPSPFVLVFLNLAQLCFVFFLVYRYYMSFVQLILMYFIVFISLEIEFKKFTFQLLDINYSII